MDVGEKLSEKELCPDELLKGQEEAFARDIERLRAKQSQFVTVSCPACASADCRPELEKFGFSYVTCNQCETLYMNPRPSPEIMTAYYADSENYRYWAKYIFPASEASRREKIHKPWLRRVVDYCKRFGISKGTLVEIGSGFGTFCSVAQESGQFQRVIAVEPTPEMAQACRNRGLEVSNCRIEDIDPGELPPADVVVSFEVIEHLFEPRQFLEQCARLLKPGGLLVISCPNGQGFDITLLREKSLAIDVEHLNFFNPKSLRLFLESMDFTVLQTSTPGRLDAEFVHESAIKGEIDLSSDPFLKRVIVDEWEKLGWPFQQFLAEQGLSSHLWAAARNAIPVPAKISEPEMTPVELEVKKCYATWSTTYYGDYYASEKTYPPIHIQIVRNLLKESGARSLLDAGCGPASMLRDLVDLNISLYGFDLTPEMVVEARRILCEKGVLANHVWKGSVLDPGAFRPPGTKEPTCFDAAICIGVMPHIPMEADTKVICHLRNAVKEDGLVVIEARNQFFSLFTLNRYSHQFFMDELIRAKALISQNEPNIVEITEVFKELATHFRLDLPPVRKGKTDEPGYDEVLSRTHNPLVLKDQFIEAGFEDVKLLFYHYHCLPPMFETQMPDFFRKKSVEMENPEDWRGYFMASAFLLTGRRA